MNELMKELNAEPCIFSDYNKYERAVKRAYIDVINQARKDKHDAIIEYNEKAEKGGYDGIKYNLQYKYVCISEIPQGVFDIENLHDLYDWVFKGQLFPLDEDQGKKGE